MGFMNYWHSKCTYYINQIQTRTPLQSDVPIGLDVVESLAPALLGDIQLLLVVVDLG